MKHLLFILCTLATTTTHTSCDKDRPCIIDLDRPTDRTVYFAGDSQWHLYPQTITDRLAMIKATATIKTTEGSDLFETQRVIDFSHTPDLTQKKFDTLAQIMAGCHDLKPMLDLELLEWIERANSLLAEDDEAITNLVSNFLRRLRSLNPRKTYDNTGSEALLRLVNNKQADVITQHTVKLTQFDARNVRLGKKIDDLTYDHKKYDDPYYYIVTNYNMENWPIPNYKKGKPDRRQFPLSLKNLLDIGVLHPDATEIVYRDGGISSLKGLELFPNIRKLILTDNEIQELPEDPFKHNRLLEAISLTGNPLLQTSTLDLKVFKGLPLKELAIINTGIFQIKRADGSLQNGTFNSLEPELPGCTVIIAGLMLGSPFIVGD